MLLKRFWGGRLREWTCGIHQCAANENHCASFEGKSQCGTHVDGVNEKILK